LPLRESEAKILLALLEGGDSPIMSLPKRAGLGSNAVYNSIRWLSERELVKDTREEKLPRRRLIKLTENGKKVAELLESIERSL
jgi:DNA-binding MarR family transcriptional regulator